MIKDIAISGVATYDPPGITLNDLKHVNFIYGANGTGKTTISRLIHNPSDASYSDCNVQWEGSTPLKTLTYNKDFRERNFGKGTIDGVFTLGEATRRELDEINEKKIELDDIKKLIETKKHTVEGLRESSEGNTVQFTEDAWIKLYKVYEELFGDAFKGFKSKERFKNKILEEYRDNDAELLSLEALKPLVETLLGEKPVALSRLTIPKIDELLRVEKEGIWKKKVIGKADIDISKAINRLNISDWVSQGLEHVEGDTCPFCQENTITEELLHQFDEYFDESFRVDITEVKSNADEYKRVTENIVNQLNEILDGQIHKLNKELFSAHLETLKNIFQANIELIKSKKLEPSRSIQLQPSEIQLDELIKLLTEANDAINLHNSMVDNFTSELESLKKSIWKFLINEGDGVIKAYIKRFDGLKRGVESLEKEIQEKEAKRNSLRKEIEELVKNVTSIQPTIDEINKTLLAFGYDGFKIEPSDSGTNQYKISRKDGEDAEQTLSEGEITFITFLYFMQFTQGSTQEEEVTKDRILVIDDPISSLDSNILFIVSTLIKKVLVDVKSSKGYIRQVILLTHNVYFHKEVSFINGRSNGCNKTNYWMIRKVNNVSSIESYEQHNPIQNSYELLWQELNMENNSGVSVQNTMRRIIENYFKILGKLGDDEILDKFTDPQEKEICRSLICWINEGSHTIPDDLYIEVQDDLIDLYTRVFREIFIKTNHIEHYNMMMKLEQ